MQTATGEMAGAITGAAVAVAEMVTGRGSATESHFTPWVAARLIRQIKCSN